MRTIKFRGKSVDDGSWKHGDLITCLGSLDKPATHILGEFNDQYEVDGNTVGQFTGAQDKNGADIYEGDVLRSIFEDKVESCGYTEAYNEVRFGDGAFGIIGETTGKLFPFSGHLIGVEEVVGNIHDNPELLK